MSVRSLAANFGLFGAITVALLLTDNPYWINVASLMTVYAMLALSTNVIFGFAGQISFGQAGLMAIGAYVTALLQRYMDVPFILAAPAALAACIVAAIVVGIPVLGLKHHYLAMATFAFHVIVSVVLFNWVELTGGPLGVLGLTRPAILGSDDNHVYLVFSVVVLFVVFVLLENLVASSVGRSFRAVREDEHAAAALGIPVARVKLFAFTISAVLAGVAGIVYTHLNNYISPDSFSVKLAVVAFMMVAIGGRGHNVGVLIGVAIFTVLPEVVRSIQDFNEIFMSAVLILTMLFLPDGLVQLTPWLRYRLQRAGLDDKLVPRALRAGRAVDE